MSMIPSAASRPLGRGTKLRTRCPVFLNSLPDDERIPDDLVIAMGGGNQRMYIIPSLELVLVRQQRITRAGPVPSEFLDQAFWQHLLEGG